MSMFRTIGSWNTFNKGPCSTLKGSALQSVVRWLAFRDRLHDCKLRRLPSDSCLQVDGAHARIEHCPDQRQEPGVVSPLHRHLRYVLVFCVPPDGLPHLAAVQPVHPFEVLGCADDPHDQLGGQPRRHRERSAVECLGAGRRYQDCRSSYLNGQPFTSCSSGRPDSACFETQPVCFESQPRGLAQNQSAHESGSLPDSSAPCPLPTSFAQLP